MGADRQIAVVGVSDEETAHLRLLIRKAAADLNDRWRWGTESGADLLIVDASSFAGQMARTRAQAAGMRCAVFTDEEATGDELVLRRPLKLANVVAVLNRAVAGIARPEGVAPQRTDFYVRDVGAPDGEPAPAESGEGAAFTAPADAAPGLEDLLRTDDAEIKAAREVDVKLGEDTTVFGTSGPTARSEARTRDAPDLFAAPDDRPGPRRAVVADTTRHSLREFLEGDLLGGPVRAALPEAPSLVLDPKLKVFHSTGRLAELEPYCRTALRVGDWQPLTSAELAELRKTEPPEPYQRLVWLYVLVHSEGRLARHLDPGGTYRLVRWVEIERDFSSYFRIASTLLTPAPLHEIAAAADAPMADVFDVVNAYDAIGLIECKPRANLRPSESAKKSPGLLQRLRKPFSRS